MRNEVFAVRLYFNSLGHFLNHNVVFLVGLELVVTIVGDAFKHQSITRCQTNVDSVLCKGVCQEVSSVQVSVHCLDHGPYHFSDLVVQEALAFKIEMDELQSSWISRVCNLEGVLVNIHEVICLQLHHEPGSSSLVGSHVFRVIVVLFGAFECFTEKSMHFGFVFF